MNHKNKDILMSIKPVYADLITSGQKRVEFRKRKLPEPSGRIYMYATAPIKKITGFFTISKQDRCSPHDLWSKYQSESGFEPINKSDFFSYWGTHIVGIGILIKSVTKFETPVNPYEIFNNFHPPQSFSKIGALDSELIDNQAGMKIA